jgi:hypothetical protein
MIATLEPTLEISAAPMEAERTEEVAATITAPPDKPATNGGKSSLSGVPPPMFNGDRDKSELFLDKFLGYELINADAKQFTIPYLKVALCLSYITGPKVDAWAKQKRAWLQNQYKVHHVPMTSESHWDDFEADFRAAFTDTDAKIMAAEKLNNLKMIGSDIDTYIAEFDRLTDEIGYRKERLGDTCQVQTRTPATPPPTNHYTPRTSPYPHRRLEKGSARAPDSVQRTQKRGANQRRRTISPPTKMGKLPRNAHLPHPRAASSANPSSRRRAPPGHQPSSPHGRRRRAVRPAHA